MQFRSPAKSRVDLYNATRGLINKLKMWRNGGEMDTYRFIDSCLVVAHSATASTTILLNRYTSAVFCEHERLCAERVVALAKLRRFDLTMTMEVERLLRSYNKSATTALQNAIDADLNITLGRKG